MEGFASGLMSGMGAMDQHRAVQLENQQRQIQIQQARQQQQMQQTFMQKMQELGSGQAQGTDRPPMDQSEQLDAIGKLQMESGMIKQGEATIGEAALLRSRSAAATASQARTVASQATAMKVQAQMVGSIVGNVTDQASWDRAKTLYAAQTGRMLPFADQPYNPAIVKHLRDSAMTAYQQAELANQQAAQRTRDQVSKVLDTKRGLEIQKLRTEVTTGVKVGAGKTGLRTPPKAMVTLAQNQIASNFNILASEDQALLSERVAEGAMDLMTKNPALKTSEAMAQSYLQRLQAGDFKQYTPVKKGVPTEVPPLPSGFVLEGGEEGAGDVDTGEEE